MKRIIAIFFAITMMATTCSASIVPYVEAKSGGIFFLNHILKELYPNNGGIRQIETGVNFHNYALLALNGQFFHTTGAALNAPETKTTLSLNALALFIKAYLYTHDPIQCYVGAGPRLLFFKTHDRSPHIEPITTKNAWGTSLTLGMQIFANHLFFDPFAEIFIAPQLQFPPNKSSLRYPLNVNYWILGLGIGYQF